MNSEHAGPTPGGRVHRFPRNFDRRRRRALIIIPLLFYGSLLSAMALSGPVGTWNMDFLAMTALFLTLVVAFLLVLVKLQRPWVEVRPGGIQVGSHGFKRSHLRSVIVHVDRRRLFERPPYQLVFLVVEPGIGPRQFHTDPIYNVQDLDAVVRELRGLLPDVTFHDRTLSGGAAISRERMDEMVEGSGDGEGEG